MCPGPEKWSGENNKGNDDGAIGPDHNPCHTLPYSSRCNGGAEVLLGSIYWDTEGEGCAVRCRGGDEPGLLHPFPGNLFHGNIRYIYVQGEYPLFRSLQDLSFGYFRRRGIGADNISFLFLFLHLSGCRTITYFRHTSQCIYKYEGRKSMGDTVFCLHVFCCLKYGDRCL